MSSGIDVLGTGLGACCIYMTAVIGSCVDMGESLTQSVSIGISDGPLARLGCIQEKRHERFHLGV